MIRMPLSNGGAVFPPTKVARKSGVRLLMKNAGASQAAIQYHYDVGNDFYTPWLGATMIYSAGLWPDERRDKVSLEEAQRAKLDWHVASARLRRGGRLLDIGCGWGGLMRRAVESAGVAEAVGLTLSAAQQTWISEYHSDLPIRAEVRPWQEFADQVPFDGIVSVGAFEHFARPEMERAGKIGAYADFFRFCADNLVDGGCLSLQTIVWMTIEPEQELRNLPAHIFPESNLPHTPEVMEAATPFFHLLQFHNRPLDYSRTLREWIRGLGANRASLAELHGTDTVKRYRDGFANFVLGFERGVIGLTRYQFQKR
jgi:cyclopropane-fatty-acyl-phospholipid synthase